MGNSVCCEDATVVKGEFQPIDRRSDKLNSKHLSRIQLTILPKACSICEEPIPVSQKTNFQCEHSFHKLCFQHFARERINNKRFPLTCPQEQCSAQLQTIQVQQLLSPQLMQKYYDFTFQAYIQSNQGLHFCLTPGCTFVFDNEEEIQEYECPICLKQYCLNCKAKMHHGQTCEQFKSDSPLSKEEKEFIEYNKNIKSKQCRKCLAWVVKIEGCNHITCRCGHQFCYLCGKTYKTCACDDFLDENEMPNQRNPEESELEPGQIHIEIASLEELSSQLSESSVNLSL